MNDLVEDIKKTRNIKDISLKNYISVINQISKKTTGEEYKTLDFLKNYDNIMNIINLLNRKKKRSMPVIKQFLIYLERQL